VKGRHVHTSKLRLRARAPQCGYPYF
jgi:hypothetical protein